MALLFCPSCGQSRIGTLRYCAGCQFDFEDADPSIEEDTEVAALAAPPEVADSWVRSAPVPAGEPSNMDVAKALLTLGLLLLPTVLGYVIGGTILATVVLVISIGVVLFLRSLGDLWGSFYERLPPRR